MLHKSLHAAATAAIIAFLMVASSAAQAQQEILSLARRLEAEGKVVLKLETGDEMLA